MEMKPVQDTRARLPVVVPDAASAQPSIEVRLALSEHREAALRAIIRALLISIRPFGLDRKRFKRCVAEEGQDSPNEPAASARHLTLHQECRRVLREVR